MGNTQLSFRVMETLSSTKAKASNLMMLYGHQRQMDKDSNLSLSQFSRTETLCYIQETVSHCGPQILTKVEMALHIN